VIWDIDMPVPRLTAPTSGPLVTIFGYLISDGQSLIVDHVATGDASGKAHQAFQVIMKRATTLIGGSGKIPAHWSIRELRRWRS
jgi:hypothetical protein